MLVRTNSSCVRVLKEQISINVHNPVSFLWVQGWEGAGMCWLVAMLGDGIGLVLEFVKSMPRRKVEEEVTSIVMVPLISFC